MAKKPKKMTTREFSRLSGLSMSAVTQMIRQGEIQAVKAAGRWQIPEDQLRAPAVQAAAGKKPAGAAKKPSPPKKAPAASAPKTGDRLSVGDFSARTYLTEHGVVQYLKQGRLQGGQDENGQWWVDAANLQNPSLHHLLRANVP